MSCVNWGKNASKFAITLFPACGDCHLQAVQVGEVGKGTELLFSAMFLSVTVLFLSFVFGAFFYTIILDSFILLQLLHKYIVF